MGDIINRVQISKIKAVLEAAEEVVEQAKERNDKATEKLVKVTAYDRIREIVQGYPFGQNDWQE